MVSGSGSVVVVGAVVLRWLGGQNGVELALRIGQHFGCSFDLLCGAEPPDLADLADDFGDIGDLLTTRVAQPANGWFAFMSLLRLCVDDGVEFALVDNARFRADPDDVLSQLFQAWGLPYDDAVTSWTDLESIRPRIVMSDLAAGPEYDWYYARTLGSTDGIVRTDRPLVPLERFPDVLRGETDGHLTIDQAVAWYEMLLARPEVL